MNFPAFLAKLNWYPIMSPTQTSKRSSCEQKKLTLSELSRRDAEKRRTLKEMSQGGQSQLLEWAMVHTLAWKHDIAEGGKTPFYHSVRFAPSLPVKHAICPRHRSSCWLIECDRAIHTLLPIRHYLLQGKKKESPPEHSDGLSGRGHQPPQGLWLCPSGGVKARGYAGRWSLGVPTSQELLQTHIFLYIYSVFNKTELYLLLEKKWSSELPLKQSINMTLIA